MLTVDQLQKTYASKRGHVEAIRNVSFTVEQGDFVCIVGPSGAGKTTLLKCLSGLLRPTSGQLTLNGQPILEPPKAMAVVSQDYTRSLLPWLTNGKNVALPLRNKISSQEERQERVHAALHAVGLDGFQDKYPWQLSGGMQQRVAIARGIAYQPEVLVMDEPFASVDAQTRADLEDLTLKVAAEQRLTVLLVTHDIDEAVYLADRVVVLSGRPSVVMETVEVPLPRPRDQLVTKSAHEFVELRAHVLKLVRGASAHVTSGDVSGANAVADHG